MVPTMILFGFAFGRWWKVSVPVAAVVWPIVLAADGIELDVGLAFGAASLGAANAAAGAAVFTAVAAALRALRHGIRDL